MNRIKTLTTAVELSHWTKADFMGRGVVTDFIIDEGEFISWMKFDDGSYGRYQIDMFKNIVDLDEVTVNK